MLSQDSICNNILDLFVIASTSGNFYRLALAWGYILDDSKLYSADTDKGTRKKLLSVFFMLRGGYPPPIPLRVFGQNDFPLKGEGDPPIPLRKKSAKKQLFLAKKRQF